LMAAENAALKSGEGALMADAVLKRRKLDRWPSEIAANLSLVLQDCRDANWTALGWLGASETVRGRERPFDEVARDPLLEMARTSPTRLSFRQKARRCDARVESSARKKTECHEHTARQEVRAL